MFHYESNKNTNFLSQLHIINTRLMLSKLIRSISYLFKYLPFIGLTLVLAQSDGKISGDIKEAGLYYKDIAFDWKPPNKEFDLHTLDIGELRFSFSNMKLTHFDKVNSEAAGITFSGPDFSMKDLTFQSNVRSKNWITQEKIRRLKKRESIPKEALKLIVEASDLFILDHDTLPIDINELVIKKYISMDTPPLNNNTWTYYLDLPEKIISKPTHLNLVPDRNSISYDWNSRNFRVDSEQDSLYSLPLVDWKYEFKINEIGQLFTSDLQMELEKDTMNFDIMMKRGQFKIKGCSFTAIPNDILDDRTQISLPDMMIETRDLALSGRFDKTPTLYRGGGLFRIRNFEIKIPEDLKEEPEIQSILDIMGIWNNSIMLRLLEFELNLLNQFTGDLKFKFHTPFMKISCIGDFSIRQNNSLKPDIYLHNTEIRIHPISLGIRKYIRNWEKDNGKTFTRKGGTIVLNLDGPIQNPNIQGY